MPDGRFCAMGTFHAVRYNTLKRTCGPQCKMGLPPCTLAYDAAPLPTDGTVDQLFIELPKYEGSAREQKTAKRDGKRAAPQPISARPGFRGGAPKAKMTAKEARLEQDAHDEEDDEDDGMPNMSDRTVVGEGSGASGSLLSRISSRRRWWVLAEPLPSMIASAARSFHSASPS
jgi:hypothetical protein